MVTPSGFDFNEHQGTVVFCDKIQFPSSEVQISLKNSVAFFLKHLFRQAFR
jgi:hypothetical protein